MATSGLSTFNLTRDQIIASAARKIGAIAAGETPTAATVNDFAQALNAMVKRWGASGIHVWTEAEATLFLQQDQVAYSLGSAGTDHATESYAETELTTTAALGATTLAVSSATGLAASQNIGIEQDDGTVHWTTISGVPTTTVTLVAPLTVNATTGSRVIAYTTKIIRPLRLLGARRYDQDHALDTEISPMARLDYRNMPNKTNRGPANQYFYDPRGGANALGILHIWPAPANTTYAVKFTWQRPIQDFSTAGNNPDLPQEWADTLIFNLGVVMAPEYDLPLDKFTILKSMADEYLDDMRNWDREQESVLFSPDTN